MKKIFVVCVIFLLVVGLVRLLSGEDVGVNELVNYDGKATIISPVAKENLPLAQVNKDESKVAMKQIIVQPDLQIADWQLVSHIEKALDGRIHRDLDDFLRKSKQSDITFEELTEEAKRLFADDIKTKRIVLSWINKKYHKNQVRDSKLIHYPPTIKITKFPSRT